jgi:hypothetical protein
VIVLLVTGRILDQLRRVAGAGPAAVGWPRLRAGPFPPL